MTTLLTNKEELEYFLSFIPETQKDDILLMSLSCRNKYLTQEERAEYQLSRLEMFERQLLTDKKLETFEYNLKKMYYSLQYRTTKNGKLYPPHATMVYFSLNPTSSIEAYFSFEKVMNEEVKLYINALRNNHSKEVYYQRFNKSYDILKSEFHKHSKAKNFVDADFDTKDFSYVERFLKYLKEKGTKYFVIETKSGYHVVLNRQTIDKKNMFYVELGKLNCLLKREDSTKEIIMNNNGMVPLCGTNQAGFEVKVLRGV